MIIKRTIDVEEEIRQAMAGIIPCYVRPLPKDFTIPSILITSTGGTEAETIDTFMVSIEARGHTEAEADLLLRNALGVLRNISENQTCAIRSLQINANANWGSDPARPDLKLRSATVTVMAHKDTVEL